MKHLKCQLIVFFSLLSSFSIAQVNEGVRIEGNVDGNPTIIGKSITNNTIIDIDAIKKIAQELFSSNVSNRSTNVISPSQTNLNIDNSSEINNNNYPDCYYDDGIMYLTKNEYNKAIVFLDRFIELYEELYPDTDTILQRKKDAYYFLGIAYFYNEEYEKAIDFLKKHQTIPEACYYIGCAYDQIGNHETAMTWYKDKDNKYCYHQIGISYLYEQDNEEAMKYFKKAITLDSFYLEAYLGIGDAYYYNQQCDSAIVWYNKAIEKDSTYAIAYNLVGDIYNYNKHNPDSALYYYNKVVNLFNSHIQYTFLIEPNATMETYPFPNYYEIGDAYFYQKDYDRATEYYNRAKELYPNSVYDYNCLVGNVYYNKQDYDKAINYYQEAVNLAPDSSHTIGLYVVLGGTYLQKQNYDEAIGYFEKAADIAPDSIKNFFEGFVHITDFANFIDNYYSDGSSDDIKQLMYKKTDKVLEFFKELIDLKRSYVIDTDNAYIYWAMGNVYLLRSDDDIKNKDAIDNIINAAKLGNEQAKQWLKDNDITWKVETSNNKRQNTRN